MEISRAYRTRPTPWNLLADLPYLEQPVAGQTTETMGAEMDERHPVGHRSGTDDRTVPATHEERVLVVGKGVALSANVTSCDEVIVEGHFEGNVNARVFVLAEGGQMEGEVKCADARVGGKIEGSIITSKTLMIGSRAVVMGRVAYDSLQIADGGRLQGKMMHYSSLAKDTPPLREKSIEDVKTEEAGADVEVEVEVDEAEVYGDEGDL